MAGMLVRCVVLTVLLALVSPVSAVVVDEDLTTSPGKEAVFFSRLEWWSPAGLFELSGVISKGKAHSVVRVDATYLTELGVAGPNVCPTQPTTIRISATVNGRRMTGWPGMSCPANAYDCSVSGTLWLDLDAAEAAQPGLFKGQPLTITVSGEDYGQAACELVRGLTVSVQQVKK
jgi:hypothetical protein